MPNKHKMSIVSQTHKKSAGTHAKNPNSTKPPQMNNSKRQNVEQNGKVKKTKFEIPSIDELAPDLSVLDFSDDFKNGSIEHGKDVLGKLIGPTTVDDFIRNIWEKKHLLVKHKKAKFFENLISIEGIDDMLKKNVVEFTKDIDIASYKDGKRETLNPDGRANPAIVWEFYNAGNSIRLLNPSQYFPEIYKLCAILQEYFHCKVGANVYLTPPGEQGFAPHYDDIEALVLQIQGKKRWRLYSPLSEDQTLPRESSSDFDQKQIGKPILDVTLEAGDFLYFPRGMIHQANCAGTDYSLHVTLSCYQKNTWGDVMKRILEDAIDTAMNENLELRKGVPLDLHRTFGVSSSKSSTQRHVYFEKIQKLFETIKKYANFDKSVDMFALEYQHSALPPALNAFEQPQTALSAAIKLNSDKTVCHGAQLTEKSKIRLVKGNILRLINSDDGHHIYYHNENSCQYQEKELLYSDVSPEDVDRIKLLVQRYPEFVQVDELPTDKELEDKYVDSDDDEDEEPKFNRNVDFAQMMFDKGFLMLESDKF